MPTKKKTNPLKPPLFTLKRQIELLFESAERRGLSTHLQTIADESKLAFGTIQALKAGEHSNPGWTTLKKFGAYFNVHLAYFDTQTEEEALRYLEMVEANKRGIPLETTREGDLYLLRGDTISEEGKRALQAMIVFILEKERKEREQEEDRRNENDS